MDQVDDIGAGREAVSQPLLSVGEKIPVGAEQRRIVHRDGIQTAEVEPVGISGHSRFAGDVGTADRNTHQMVSPLRKVSTS